MKWLLRWLWPVKSFIDDLTHGCISKHTHKRHSKQETLGRPPAILKDAIYLIKNQNPANWEKEIFGQFGHRGVFLKMQLSKETDIIFPW